MVWNQSPKLLQKALINFTFNLNVCIKRSFVIIYETREHFKSLGDCMFP